MYFRYGRFTHLPGEVALQSFQTRKLRTPRNQAFRYQKVLNCSLEIIADGQSAIRNRCRAIQNAYSLDGYDAGFWHDDDTRGEPFLDNASSESGVIVVDFPSLARGDGADYATHHGMGFTLSADYIPLDAAEIMDYAETLAHRGTAGPRTAWQVTDVGAPVQWTLAQRTTQQVLQSGFAVGRRTYPQPNRPMFGMQYLKHEETEIRRETPDLDRRTFTGYKIFWTYVFEFGEQVGGLPRTR
jgi:hypothetical protein